MLYVAAKGRLTAYTAVLWGPTNASLPPFLGIPNLQVGIGSAGGSGANEPKASPRLPPSSNPFSGLLEGGGALEGLIEGAGSLLELA